MLDWILKYKVRVPGAANKPAAVQPADKAAATSAATPAPAPGDAGKAGQQAGGKRPKAGKAAAPEVPASVWENRLQAAQGDDSALLALAQTAGLPLTTKLAAITALESEAAVKDAERAFRNHDRRVHTLAKQRAQGMRVQRETRAKADQLIEAAQALTASAQIPVNSAVELDRAWSALDATLLQAPQREAFAALTAALSALTWQRAEQEACLKRWAADARPATQNLQALCNAAANGTEAHSALDDACTRTQTLADAAPAGADSTALWTPLLEALATAQALSPRLQLLDRVLSGPQRADNAPPDPAPVEAAAPEAEVPPPAAALESGAAETAVAETAVIERAVVESAVVESPVVESAVVQPVTETAAAETAATAIAVSETAVAETVAAEPSAVERAASPAQQWQQLPPLANSRLAAVLEQRFQSWQHEQEAARQTQRAARRTQAKEQQRAVRSERAEALQAALQTALGPAETSLAQGLVAETHKHLLAIDELLHAGAPADALRARIGALQDGYAELRGWQHWAGGRARDDLTQEAVALAATCAPGPDGQLPKLQFKAHADLIDGLRARWKELDSLGGASSRALWQRFDGALKTAYEPLAAQKAAQSATREQNLGQRRLLLDALENVTLPLANGTVAAAELQPQDGTGAAAAELRPAMAALEQFRIEWRRLGPLEHTVPHKAREALAARMEAAQQRLQAPLDEVWQRAQQQRQSLIERAQALAAQAQAQAQAMSQTQSQAQAQSPPQTQSRSPSGSTTGARGSGVDMVGEVRNLQNQWQQCAKAMPLPRNAENALWSQFRSALDAVFSARDAVFSARDAEFKAGADERLALIARLEALGEASAADTQRTLAETHAQWQRCGPAPRAEAAALDDRYWRAQDAAQHWLAGSKQRSWQALCDALAAKLALCEAQERSGAAATTGNVSDRTPAAGGPADDTEAAWAALPALPDAWETALRQRAGFAVAGAAAAGAAGASTATASHAALSLDTVLLQLEAAWNLPSAPEFATARRELQLQAMKAALETRRANAAGVAAATPDQWLAEALRRPPQAAAQQERLVAVLAALRQRGPAPAQTRSQLPSPPPINPSNSPPSSPPQKPRRTR